jgi:hypothetical protein
MDSLPGSPRIHYYAAVDIVAHAILSGQAWEGPDIQNILWAMGQPLPPQAASSSQKALFVDIGANIGWFTANVASHGYHVAAFEGEVDGARI